MTDPIKITPFVNGLAEITAPTASAVIPVTDGASTKKMLLSRTLKDRFVAVFDGGGAAVAANKKVYVYVAFDCTIVAAHALADQSGSIVVDIWKDTYANYPPTDADTITASAPVTISTAIKSTDTTLTGWTKTLAAGDVLCFNVDATATSITWVTIILEVLK